MRIIAAAPELVPRIYAFLRHTLYHWFSAFRTLRSPLFHILLGSCSLCHLVVPSSTRVIVSWEEPITEVERSQLYYICQHPSVKPVVGWILDVILIFVFHCSYRFECKGNNFIWLNSNGHIITLYNTTLYFLNILEIVRRVTSKSLWLRDIYKTAYMK